MMQQKNIDVGLKELGSAGVAVTIAWVSVYIGDHLWTNK
jgi:hypothetical protein